MSNNKLRKLNKKKKRCLLTLNVLISLKNVIKIKERNEKRFWVNPVLVNRGEMSIEDHLLKDLQWGNDGKDFKNFTRITITEFEEILLLVCMLSLYMVIIQYYLFFL